MAAFVPPKLQVIPWRRRPKRPWTQYAAINPEFALRTQVDARFNTSAERLGRDPLQNDRAHRIAVAGSGTIHQASDLSSGWRAGFGVELRDPTADVRVVEFCFGLSMGQYFHHGQDRGLIRRAMREFLPPEIVDNVRRGQQAADWYEQMTSARAEIIQEISRLEHSDLSRHCLDLTRMRHLAENWPTGGWDSSDVTRSYLFVLNRGIMLGRFIRWFEDNRR